MTKMTHTPGPWRVFSWATNNDDSGKTWCYGMDIKKGHDTFAEHEANARLMSAAPDLLAALQKLKWVSIDKDNMEFKCETTCFVLDEIRASIAKATGET